MHVFAAFLSSGARFCELALLEGSSAKSLAELASLLWSLPGKIEFNQNQTDGLVIAVYKIFNSLSSNDEDFSSLGPIRKLVTAEKVKLMIKIVSSDEAREAVLNISSTLLSSPSLLRDVCMDIVLCSVGISENLEKQRVVLAARKLIFTCGMSELMLEGLANELESALSGFADKFGVDFAETSDMSTPKVKKKHAKNAKSSKFLILPISELAAKAAAAAWQALAEVFIRKSIEFEDLDASPVLAYMNYAKYTALQEDPTRASSDPTIIDDSFDHVLHCFGQLLTKLQEYHGQPSMSRRGRSSQKIKGAQGCEVKGTLSVVKVLTAVLKFAVDATSTNLIKADKLLRCLKFGSTYTKYITLGIKNSDQDTPKETLLLLRSSYTYMTKLLHLVITSSDDDSREEVFWITNSLLDLVPCAETCLGARQASLPVEVAKRWLPVFLLGLGYKK